MDFMLGSAITDFLQGLGGMLGLVLFLVFVIVVIVWIVFPFLMVSGLNKLEKLLKRENELLTEQNEILAAVAERQNETTKALHWIVDQLGKKK
jgi:hypothetical protein